MAKFKIELNNSENIREILQIAYNLSDEQLIQAQNEINRMVNATQLQNEVMDSKTKFAKSINDYLNIKDKAISKKMEIAKLLTEILNHNGNVGGSAEGGTTIKQSFDITKIKEMVKSMHDDNKEKTKTIELTKK